MRDLALLLVIGAILPAILARPHVGVLAFAWISLMNPHRLTYGFAYGLPLAFLVFAVTLIAWLPSGERKTPGMTGLAWLLLAFTLWFSLTTSRAWAPEPALDKFSDAIKVMAAFFLTITLVDRRERLMALVWVMTFSLGFYGVKGGLFTLLSGGATLVWGPPDTFITDNNSLALALVMVAPLLLYAAECAEGRGWLRLALLAALGLTLVAVVGTWSRGGLVALLAMGGVLWLRSRSKLLTGALALAVLLVALAAMPPEWFERMGTIETYEEDASANLRFFAWSWATDVALQSPLLGGGFSVFVLNGIQHGSGSSYLNAHSIYFEVLGEHGFVGLGLFLAIGAGALLATLRLMRATRARPDLLWAHRLAAAIQVSLVGYAVGGAFLNMAFYDFYYYLLAVLVVMTRLVHEAPAVEEPRAEEGPGPDLRRRLLGGI
ncbi:putative O-glycosylation ligase, exosortase A system-associated [Geminicoccaceae bacterium 1502E]|nr:putative O-glycosylation ligase, exosortase A system-associated [Geminicoccaceae bacterium 1502E]